MEKNIYVFGHTNPDTDSICSAVAYTHLKKALGTKNITAARLGKLSKEAQFALGFFNTEPPILLESVHPQVSDLNYYATPPIYLDDPVQKAWDVMAGECRSMVPIVDADHKLAGVISISDIAKTYIGLTDSTVLKKYNTPFKNITTALEGHLVAGHYHYDLVLGDVYTTASINQATKLTDKDIIITGSNELHINMALDSGAGCIIITDQTNKHLSFSVDDKTACAIIFTPYSFFQTIKMIVQSIPVKNNIIKQNLVYFELDDHVEDVKEVMVASPHSYFPIVDKNCVVKGVLSKRHLIDIKKKQVILVDHNEQNQSVQGIQQAEILEIIDHHRIANIDTANPIFLRAEPVGCTSTIIWKLYQSYQITPTREIAGLMLSAILSDTLIFKSPTCTADDIAAAKNLAQLAEVNLEEYGSKLLAAGSSLEGCSALELLEMDRKPFGIGKFNISVSQINTADFKSLYDLRPAILEEMDNLKTQDNLDLVLFMVTDIVVGGTELFVLGPERWIAERAFGIPKTSDSLFLPDVFSRKKQIIPQLMSAAQN